MGQPGKDVPLNQLRVGRIRVVIAGLLLLTAQCAAWASAASDADFSCGGKVESQVWQLWDDSGKAYVSKDELADRLLAQGDTYALYEVQVFTHNLVDMARRCQRVDRLEELAQVFGVAYRVLGRYPGDRTSVAWLCTGGITCSSKNGWLMNREVMLTSVQFLGLVSSIANGLASAAQQKQDAFVEQTAIASVKHLLRWGDAEALSVLDTRIAAKAQDITNGDDDLFFSDKELWMITIYAELAGILQQQPTLRAKAGLTDRKLAAMHAHLSRLLRLFAARITVKPAIDRNGQAVQVADLDSGFWRLWDEFKYAGYTGSQKPVTCPGPTVKLEAPEPVEDLGWDIGHASRLVHAFDAIERNRQAMQEVFGIKEAAIPSSEIVKAFARQIVVKVWNGDAEFPLFSNYMSGANGWYRVAYDNGTGACSEGYPPSFLTDEFMTGGYASWARYAPEIRPLGRRLYQLSEAKAGSKLRFMDKYYPKLGVNASPGNSMLNRLMAWPSLVEARQ